MKSGLFMFLMVSFCAIAVAERVSVDRARRVGIGHRNRLQSQTAMMSKSATVQQFTEDDIIETHTIKDDDGLAVYYVFNLKPEGWVIISADDVARPIIAYSHEGSYSASPQDQPPGFKWWMGNVKAEISDAIAKKLEPLDEAKTEWQQIETGEVVSSGETKTMALAESFPTNVPPLIKTKWGQGDIRIPFASNYNDYCPYEWIGPVQIFAVTGCWATAMAQVMKYHEWPIVGQGRGGIDTRACTPGNWGCTYGWLEGPFSSTYYDWNNMQPNFSTPATAELMYHCGVAANMQYGLPNGSMAYIGDAKHALEHHFRYNCEYGI